MRVHARINYATVEINPQCGEHGTSEKRDARELETSEKGDRGDNGNSLRARVGINSSISQEVIASDWGRGPLPFATRHQTGMKKPVSRCQLILDLATGP